MCRTGLPQQPATAAAPSQLHYPPSLANLPHVLFSSITARCN
jgi:hypothetical protein